MSRRWNRFRRWLMRGARAGILLALVAGIIYWVKFAPMPVTEQRVERGEIVAEVMGTGTLEAHDKATVSSKISGRIGEVLVEQNDRVRKGQLLVRLDDEELMQQVAIAEAQREAAEAAIARFRTDEDRAAAVFDQAMKSHGRVEALFAQKATSREELDRATEALAVAQAGLSRAEAAITEGQKELVVAEKTLEYHRARLAETNIDAPLDGLIVRRWRDPGDVVVPGTSLLTLISTDELWISAWVDETEMAELQEGQAARVVFRSMPSRSYPGTVVRLGKEADRETREFIVEVRALQLPDNWAIGQRAEVYIETARKVSDSLLPAKSVVWQGDRPGAFVMRNGYAQWMPLTLGLQNRELVEIVEGLPSTEAVIVPAESRNRLSDGQRVSS